MLWETSNLDPEEGIRFRGLTIPECQQVRKSVLSVCFALQYCGIDSAVFTVARSFFGGGAVDCGVGTNPGIILFQMTYYYIEHIITRLVFSFDQHDAIIYPSFLGHNFVLSYTIISY